MIARLFTYMHSVANTNHCSFSWVALLAVFIWLCIIMLAEVFSLSVSKCCHLCILCKPNAVLQNDIAARWKITDLCRILHFCLSCWRESPRLDFSTFSTATAWCQDHSLPTDSSTALTLTLTLQSIRVGTKCDSWRIWMWHITVWQMLILT